MSLDYGYGDWFERSEAERADLDSEDAHALLHGPDSPYTRSARAQPVVRCHAHGSRLNNHIVPSNSAGASLTDSHDTDSLVSTSLSTLGIWDGVPRASRKTTTRRAAA